LQTLVRVDSHTLRFQYVAALADGKTKTDQRDGRAQPRDLCTISSPKRTIRRPTSAFVESFGVLFRQFIAAACFALDFSLSYFLLF